MALSNQVISKNTARLITSICAGAVVFIGVMVLVGWAFKIDFLTSVYPTWIQMKVNVAICFILAGVSLWLQRDENIGKFKRLLARVFALIICIIAVLSLYEHLFDVDLGIDQLFFLDSNTQGLVIFYPGRMTVVAAVNGLLVGLALLLIDANVFKKWAYQIFISIVFPICLVTINVYLFRTDIQHAMPYYFYMAFMGAVGYMLLCLGLFMARPDIGVAERLLSNSPSGRFIQRVFFLILTVPFIIIYLTSLGVQYDIYSHAFSNALQSVIFTAVISIIVYININQMQKEEKAILKADSDLQASLKLFRGFAENTDDVIWHGSVNLDKINFVNDAFEEVWGISKEMLYHNSHAWFDLIFPEDVEKVKKAFLHDIQLDKSVRIEFKIKRPDGNVRRIYAKGFLLSDDQGAATGLIGVCFDITLLSQQHQEKYIEEYINRILETSTDLQGMAPKILRMLSDVVSCDLSQVCLVDPVDKKVIYNGSWYSPEETASDFYNINHTLELESGITLHEKVSNEKRPLWIKDIETYYGLKSNQKVAQLGLKSVIFMPIVFQEKVFGILSCFYMEMKDPDYDVIYNMNILNNKLGDFLNSRFTEERAKAIENYDKITGFFNKDAMEEKVNGLIASGKIKSAAMIIIYVESYQKINQALGLDASILLLQLIADRITKQVVKNEEIISRLESNKIAIFAPHLDTVESIVEYTHKIVAIFKDSYFLHGKDLLITEKIGIALFPEDASTVSALLECANIAATELPVDANTSFQFYSKKLPHTSSEKLKMELALQRALAKSEFELYYQPQNNFKNGYIVAYEALIRWNNPEMGRVMPNQFIPLAEETGLIILIDEWVLRTVFKKIQESFFKGKHSLGLVSVNISAQHFREPHDLVGILRKLINEFNVNPSEIEIEVTESVLLHDSEKTFSIMKDIAELGFHFALDDFGTGFSSLSYLHRVPTDKIKIDKSFIDRLPNDAYNSAIVKSTIILAHNLGKTVIAEGVETIEQVKFLMEAGCDGMQGYYFSKPLPADEIKQLILNNKILKLPD